MSISGCEKRPSLVTAVTVLSNVLPSLSDPAFLRYQKVPLGQFRPELSDHQHPTIRDETHKFKFKFRNFQRPGTGASGTGTAFRRRDMAT